MDADLKRRVDALRRPLELAAANGFAGVRKVQGLGNVLRVACDGLMQKWSSEQLAAWRVVLATWEQLPVEKQEAEVARGMRLIARLPSTSSTPSAPRERLTAAPPRAPVAAKRAVSGSIAEALAPIAEPPAWIERRVASTEKAAASGGERPAATEKPPASLAKAPAASMDPRASTEKAAASGGERPAATEKPPAPLAKAPAASMDPRASTAKAPAKAPGSATAGPKAQPEKAGSAQAPKRAAKLPLEITDPLAAPALSLPGIGPAFAERLAEKGLETVEDLLWCLPRRYDDVRDAKLLGDVVEMDEGKRATFVAKVITSRMVFVRGRRWAEVRLGPTDLERSRAGEFALPASAVVRWFNVWAGIEKRMPAGSTITLSGVVKKRSGRLELANPDILAIDIPEAAQIAELPLDGATATTANAAKKPRPMPTIIARYPDVAGVPASKLRAACQTACNRVGAIADDGVPKTIESAASMPSLEETLARLHEPPSDISAEDLASLNRGDSRWQRRLAFGELFALGVVVALRRRERRGDAAVPCPRAPDLEMALAKALPFEPTSAQRRAFREMGDDLARPSPMNRLLQGDVGSGKTCVAFAAALQVARAGRQTALMAPTELLAEQHAETWRAWAKATGLRIELLTASTPKPTRQSLLALLGAGKIDVLLGTHSLIAEGVGFHGLGLVVIDEQHRFGVAQRAKLRDKGDGQGAPHLLVMTATPIPRTLALTAYGDLDVSILDELPPGREPAQTKILAGKRGETAAYKLIGERVAAGERAYVVCPKVEDDPDSDSDWKDATTVAKELAAAQPQLRVGLVHGRLDGEARDRVMRAFKHGDLDVLVATTVIEVGVDIPAATVMVVHDAERFGLAQLHQLRGRVGRGGGVAHCVLVTGGSVSEDGRRRLDAMVATTDGFKIAEEDLALRGPGELLGPRQAGVPRLRFGSLSQHTELLLEARGHAERILDEDPGLVRPEHAPLRAALTRRLAQSVYGAESG